MKILNRPMFRMGGPIKEGIMNGIQEPRRGYNQGSMVFPANVNQMLPTGINAGNAGKIFGNVKNQYTNDSLGDKINYNPYKKDFVTYQEDKMITEKDIDLNNDGRISTKERMKFQIQDDERRSDLIKKKYEPLIAKPNTTDKIITTQYGSYENPNYIPPGLDEKSSINIEKAKIGLPENISQDMGSKNLPNVKDIIEKKGEIENTPLTKKQKTDNILEMLGYDKAKKSALYDAMINAGQRISRTGLGADNLVSDVIADTSRSYDKPEKLREAANLMRVQQDLKLDQIEASKDTRPQEQKLAEYYQSKDGGGYSKEVSLRMARKLPTTINEFYNASKATNDLGKVRDATNQATEQGLFGEGLQYRGKIEPKDFKGSVDIFVKSDKFQGDGVYNVGGKAIVIKDGKKVSEIVVQAKAEKTGFF